MCPNPSVKILIGEINIGTMRRNTLFSFRLVGFTIARATLGSNGNLGRL